MKYKVTLGLLEYYHFNTSQKSLSQIDIHFKKQELGEEKEQKTLKVKFKRQFFLKTCPCASMCVNPSKCLNQRSDLIGQQAHNAPAYSCHLLDLLMASFLYRVNVTFNVIKCNKLFLVQLT